MFGSNYFHELHFGGRLLWFLGLSLAGWLLSKLILLVWEKLILPLAAKTESSLDDHLAKNLHKPVSRLMVLGSVYLTAQITVVSASQIKSYIKFAENIIYLILIIFIANMVNAIIKSFIDWYIQDFASKTESTLDDTLFPILRKVIAVVIYFIAATVILGQFKVNLTGLVATAGVASLAIAFGAQAALADVIAGISIILD